MIAQHTTRAFPRQLIAGIAAFVLLALLGPLVRAVVPYSFGGDFVYSLVLSLWPAQPLAVMEVSIGTPAAIAVAIGANVALFSVVGVLAGAASRNRLALRALEITALVAVVAAALWWAGMDMRFVHIPALAVALVCYAAPFEWLARA